MQQEALHDAKAAVTNLNKEIERHRNRWEKVQSEWEPSSTKHRKPKSPKTYQRSYLDGAMATSLSGADPHRACLFEASVREMHVPGYCRRFGIPEANIPDPADRDFNTGTHDKFSTELAGVPGGGTGARSMVDFSRFLLELSGERELADARDPVRDLELEGEQGDRPSMQHDRLIR
jgi:hypothetical protein